VVLLMMCTQCTRLYGAPLNILIGTLSPETGLNLANTEQLLHQRR